MVWCCVLSLGDYRCYKLQTSGPETEEICQDGEEEIPAAQHWILPNLEFQGMWENLIYDTDIKRELIRFVSTSLLLSDKGVDTSVVTCNRVGGFRLFMSDDK